MDETPAGQRSVVVVSTGARICVLIALLMVMLAGYLFWSPLEKPTKEGIPFGCSTAASPPTDQFPKTVCGKLNERRRLQAGFVLLGAVVVGAGGVVAFGTARTVERARRPTVEDD
jgi:hypothetical protein